LARRISNNKRVAIKFPNVYSSTVECLAEAELGQEVSGDFLSHTLDVIHFTEDHRAAGWPPFAIVMEFLPITLNKVLEDCHNLTFSLSPALVHRWIKTVLEGLHSLHKKGLVHRDIKPENLFFRLKPGDQQTERKYHSPLSILTRDDLVVGDLGTICETGAQPKLQVFSDKWKDPYFYAQSMHSPKPVALMEHGYQPAADLMAVGKVIRASCEYLADFCRKPFLELADKCSRSNWMDIPSAHDLLGQLPHLPPDQVKIEPAYISRLHIKVEIENYWRSCVDADRGGLFLFCAEPGVGKTEFVRQFRLEGRSHPTFCFQYNESSHRRPVDMVESLFEQLTCAYHLDVRKPRGRPTPDDLTRLFDAVSVKASGRVLVFIDAIDEANDGKKCRPIDVVNLLPSVLPRNVLLIVTSRPEPCPGDYGFSRISPRGEIQGQKLELRAESEENIKVLTQFFEVGLGEKPGWRHARQLAEGCKGIFMLGRLLCEEIAEGKRTLASTLSLLKDWHEVPGSDFLYLFYDKSFKRIVDDGDRQTKSRFTEFFSVLSNTQDWIGTNHVLDILRLHDEQRSRPIGKWSDENEYDAFVNQLRWIVEQRHAIGSTDSAMEIQLRHPTMRQWLANRDRVNPARFHTWHERIGTYFADLAEKNGWASLDRYGRFYTIRHLLESRSQLDRAARILGSDQTLEYLQATLGDEPAPLSSFEE
jgi:serine/threonine protein kinase